MQLSPISLRQKQFQFGAGYSTNKTAKVLCESGENILNLQALKQYAVPLQYKVNMDAKELKKLFATEDNMVFCASCFDFFCKNLDIPQEIAPVFCCKFIDKQILYSYDFIRNTITQNLAYDTAKQPKNDCFTFLRHEFQHYIQNMEIYRHETLGPKWIEFLIDINKDALKELITTKPLYEWSDDFNTLKKYSAMKFHLENNNPVSFEKEYEPIAASIRSSLQAFRSKIVALKGAIKKESPSTERIKGYMKAFKDSGNYINADGSVKMSEYNSNFVEKEAFAVQFFTKDELSKILSEKGSR